jgi:hypothetical protein
MRILIATLSMAALAAAQSISPPALGFIFDAKGKSIRQVTGVPGAAALEPALDFAGSLDSAYLSSANTAIARSKNGGILALRWGGSPSAVQLDGALSEFSGVAFSASSRFAALLGASGAVQLWSLGDTPTLAAQWKLDLTPIAATVNDDGVVAVAAGASGLFVLDADRTYSISAGDIRGVAFADADRVIASDAQSNRVVTIQNWSGDAGITEIAGATDLLAPGALALGNDLNTIAVANTGASDIALIDLATGSVRHAACACHPERFEALAGAAFHIVDPSVDTDLLLDGQNARAVPLAPPVEVRQ